MPDIYGGQIVARYIKEVEGIDTIYSLSGGHIALWGGKTPSVSGPLSQPSASEICALHGGATQCHNHESMAA